MAKTSGGVRSVRSPSVRVRPPRDYHEESKRLRNETLALAEPLKNNPLRFSITNGIRMDVEITKTDLKTIVSKNTRDEKFNAIKNALARDIPGYLQKAEFIGTRQVKDGKHTETAYFAYFSRSLGTRTILAMRKMKNDGPYKPYAIISEKMFNWK